MATPTLKTIPLTDLKVSRLNMRHGRKAPNIDDLLPSVRASGIRQPLLVRPEGKGFGIVAGRRLFFALNAVPDFHRALEQQKQAAEKQDQVTPGHTVLEYGEQVIGQAHDPGDR